MLLHQIKINLSSYVIKYEKQKPWRYVGLLTGKERREKPESNFQVSFCLHSGQSSRSCTLFSVSSTTERALDCKCGIRDPALLSLQFALDVACVLRQGLDSTCVSGFLHLQLCHLGHLLWAGQRLRNYKGTRKKKLTESSFSLSLYWIWGIDTQMYSHRKWKQTLWPNTVLGPMGILMPIFIIYFTKLNFFYHFRWNYIYKN